MTSFGPKRLFRELKWEVFKTMLLNEVLNAAILFFALNIVLTLVNMSFLYSAGAAFVFLIYRMMRSWRKSTIRRLEQTNPEVHEILRTAYEHQSHNSLMVQGLMFDLQKRLSTVSAGALLSARRVFSKVLVVMFLAFTPVLIISFTPYLIQANPLADMQFGSLWSDGVSDGFFETFGVELNRSQVQYGDARILDLGDQALDIELMTGGGVLSFEQTQDVAERPRRFSDFPFEAEAVEAESAPGLRFDEADIALINRYSSCVRGDDC